MSYKDYGGPESIPNTMFDDKLKVDPNPTIEFSPENLKNMGFSKIISPFEDTGKTLLSAQGQDWEDFTFKMK